MPKRPEWSERRELRTDQTESVEYEPVDDDAREEFLDLVSTDSLDAADQLHDEIFDN